MKKKDKCDRLRVWNSLKLSFLVLHLRRGSDMIQFMVHLVMDGG